MQETICIEFVEDWRCPRRRRRLSSSFSSSFSSLFLLALDLLLVWRLLPTGDGDGDHSRRRGDETGELWWDCG